MIIHIFFYKKIKKIKYNLYINVMKTYTLLIILQSAHYDWSGGSIYTLIMLPTSGRKVTEH
jgi:hypothetical protein